MKKKIIGIEKKDKSHNIKKILVNAITGIRALGTFAIVPIFKAHGGLTTALAAMCIFATDFIDGQLARRLHVQSFFGSLLDSVSDKVFGIICLLILAFQNPIFWIPIALEGAIVYTNYRSAQNGNNIQSSWPGKVKMGVLGVSSVCSILALDAPELKDLLNYINVHAMDKVLSLDPNLLTTILAIPSIVAGGYVLGDYIKKSAKQTEAKAIKAKEESKTEPTIEEIEPTIEEIESTISDIENKKAELEEEKKKIKQLKSRKEIIHDLFDTEFYLEHKDDDIKQLLYK